MTVFLGEFLSKLFERYFREGLVKEKIIHTSVAFGGGIIIAAVAFVLVPKSINELSLTPIVIIFLSGAISFFFLDRYIEKIGGTISQLLAIFIGLQNLPESFNSYIDLRNSGYTSKKCLLILFFLSILGILAAVSGDLLLSNMPQLTASLMLFSSGGMLYLIFQDIAPMSKIQNSWFPALGVNFGFLVGMIGQKLFG
ncbi:divalent cation transporter [bacterium]|nr:divalent cation transporter [bacterium]